MKAPPTMMIDLPQCAGVSFRQSMLSATQRMRRRHDVDSCAPLVGVCSTRVFSRRPVGTARGMRRRCDSCPDRVDVKRRRS
jgi:hypothetical protein